MKGILLFGVIMLLVGTIFLPSIIHAPIMKKHEEKNAMNLVKEIKNLNSYSGDKIIDEYTWAVMRYDHEQPSVNFGNIDVPKPSPGTILVPADVMSPELCKVAIQIYSDNKMDILNNLVEFDEKNMKHTEPAILPRYDDWRLLCSVLIQHCYIEVMWL